MLSSIALLPGGSSDSIRLSLEDTPSIVTGAAVEPNYPIARSLAEVRYVALWFDSARLPIFLRQ